MYKIVKKQELTTNIYLMEVEADRVAKTCEPGGKGKEDPLRGGWWRCGTGISPGKMAA